MLTTNFNRHDAIAAKFEKIFEFAAETPAFNTAFVDSVYNYFEEHEDISDRQLEALTRIMEQWGIDE